ncbi:MULTISPECIES: phosphopantetheine-binding protein [unclassified Streptomyces]|jgi:acyl carrier protein|uniref:phosphopantetheine-binding protein n=1 Tax=unclassified Streptomyces TaxID=2593676 RepID=UPI0033A6E395
MDALTAAVDSLVTGIAGDRRTPGIDTVDLALSDRGVDSMGVVALIAAVEREFGVLFPAEMLNRRTFVTVATVAAAVRSLLDPAGGQ